MCFVRSCIPFSDHILFIDDSTPGTEVSQLFACTPRQNIDFLHSLQTPSTGATLLVDEQDASLRLLRTMFHIYTPVFRNPLIMAPRAWKLGLHSPLDHLWHSHRIIRYVVVCSSTIRSPLFQSLHNTWSPEHHLLRIGVLSAIVWCYRRCPSQLDGRARNRGAQITRHPSCAVSPYLLFWTDGLLNLRSVCVFLGLKASYCSVVLYVAFFFVFPFSGGEGLHPMTFNEVYSPSLASSCIPFVYVYVIYLLDR